MSDEERLVELLLRHEELAEQGQTVSAAELCRDTPWLLPRLEQELSRLQAVETFLDGPVTQGRASTIDTLPPQRLAGYEIQGRLGHGGMGVVYQARHTASGRLAAVKVLREGLDGSQQVSRFRHEAQVLTRLRHANIVQMLEAGEHDGRPFMVMELVTGGSLAQVLAGKPQPPREAAAQVETLARAVHVAHQAGVIHRDLKPANVLVTTDGALKVTDFGLAKIDEVTAHTVSGQLMGSVPYMAPEQARGHSHQATPATDVWALGVILYEMLTGQVPFRGDTPFQTLEQVCNADPEPPRVERDLETICLKCLHKEPGKRYPSALELGEDLRRYLENRPIRARRVGLTERLAKWRHRHPVTATLGLVATLTALMASASLLWYWDRYQRVKVEHYAAYVNRFGVNEGLVRLSPKDVRGRQVSYKFYRRSGRVEQMDIVNGLGEPTSSHAAGAYLEREPFEGQPGKDRQESRLLYRWNQETLFEVRALDRHGNEMWKLHYTSPTTAQHTTVRAHGGRDAALIEGLPEPRGRSGASYIEFTFSADGLVKEERFRDGNRRRVPDDGGAFGQRREHDERGLVLRVTYLDQNDKPMLHRTTKFASSVRQYDERGNVLGYAYFGVDGKPCLHNDGIHRLAMKYDEYGNVIEGAWFGTDGRRVPHRYGYHRHTKTYDERGNEVEVACFGVDGQPVLHKDGYHRSKRTYDERGNRIEWAFFGVDGRPTLRKEGFHRSRSKHDERGNETEWACFGVDDQPILYNTAYHRCRSRFDERGNMVEAAWFGLADEPVLDSHGSHRIVRKFDPSGNMVEWASFGVDGKPILQKGSLHYRVRCKYDERGNQLEWACFGIEDQPVLYKNGYHKYKVRYDEHGNAIAWTYFGADDNPCLFKDGYHRHTKTHDERGNVVEEAYFGVDGNPCLHNDGFHRFRRRHDERDNDIEQAYFGVDGNPCLHKDGYHKFRRRYDERENLVEAAFLGLSGQSVLHRSGFSRQTLEYDERGNATGSAYFGVDDRPVLYKNEYHRVRARFDERGKRVEWACFGVDGRPMLAGNEYHRYTTKFDERGNKVEEACFGVDQKPILCGEGYHGYRQNYDERDNVVEWACFGIDGKPIAERKGYARFTVAYDGKGQAGERTYYGVDGKPVSTQVVVRSVTLGGQGHRLGILPGDVLLRYDGKPVPQTDLFIRGRQSEKASDPTRPLVVERNGKSFTVQMAPGLMGIFMMDIVLRRTAAPGG